MTANPAHAPTLENHLAEPMRLGEPDVHGPLAVFPLFGPTPGLDYQSFAQGRDAGVPVKELENRASVNDLLVLNPTDLPVLLYEGEEVLGAQQNRTFDVSVLVAAGSQLSVPVSCVEAGRWDHGRHEESFTPAPQAAYPALRRMKNRAARDAVAAGMEPRAYQGDVWAEVAQKSSRMAVASNTSAMHDIYEGRRDRLAEFVDALPLHDGQIGALVLIGGACGARPRRAAPDVFASLHAPLLQGYALDALEAAEPDAVPPSADVAEAFLRRVLEARVSERDGIGMGRDLRFADGGVAGAGLVVGRELIQVSAFPEPGSGPARHEGRIRRPSRRRR